MIQKNICQNVKGRVIAIKAEGNEHFQKMDYEKAISVYENALNLCKGNNDLKEEQGIILKNKAACFLKMVSSWVNIGVFVMHTRELGSKIILQASIMVLVVYERKIE